MTKTKIKKTEQAISKNRERYEHFTAELEKLYQKQRTVQSEKLLRSIAVYNRSYEEVIHFKVKDKQNDLESRLSKLWATKQEIKSKQILAAFKKSG